MPLSMKSTTPASLVFQSTEEIITTQLILNVMLWFAGQQIKYQNAQE